MRGEGVKKVADLFEVYKRRLRAPQKTVIDTFVEVVDDVCNISINIKDVSYTPSSKTLMLKSAGPIKSEVFLYKDEILTHMKGRLGVQSVPEHIL